jgi:hypothetical protein
MRMIRNCDTARFWGGESMMPAMNCLIGGQRVRAIDTSQSGGNATPRQILERARLTLGTRRSFSRCGQMLVKWVELRGSAYETGFRSTLEIPARWDFGDFPLCRNHLDLVGRPDRQARRGTVAGMAAVEAVSSGPDPGGSDLVALPSGPGAVRGRRGDLGRIRASAWRLGANAAACHVGWYYRTWRRVGRQSPRQFMGGANAELAPGQRAK